MILGIIKMVQIHIVLSDYDRSWGWNLILPNQIFDNKDFITLEKNTVDTKGNTLSAGLFTLQDNLHRLLDEKYDSSIKIDTIKNFYKFYEYKEGIGRFISTAIYRLW